MYTKEHARKLAKRKYPKLNPCEKCGATRTIHRHHEDYQQPLAIRFLCRRCHVARHKERGDWGHGSQKSKACSICGKRFIPKGNHHKIKNCGPKCAAEAGRRAS